MKSPPKRKPGLCGTGFQSYPTSPVYYIVDVFTRILEGPYWFFLQWRGHLLDRYENERGNR